jgi:hypothetical protein
MASEARQQFHGRKSESQLFLTLEICRMRGVSQRGDLDMKSKQSASVLPALVIAAGITSTMTASSAHANFLSPGSPATSPDIFSSITGPVVGTISNSFSGVTINGSYTTEVIQDANRGGLLDFVIQVTNGDGQALEKITNGFFLSPDVGYVTPGGTAGTLTSTSGAIIPGTVDESINGTVGFNFSGIPSGATTAILVIETGFSQFTSGLIGIDSRAPRTMSVRDVMATKADR